MSESFQHQEHGEESPRARLGRLLAGSWVSQSIYAAVKLGVADALSRGPARPGDVAASIGVEEPNLYRLLRALAAVGLFFEDRGGRFSLTEVGEYLRSDRPDSVAPLMVLMGEEIYQAWGQLLYSLRTGKAGFDRAHGVPFFEYLTTNTAAGQRFDRCMEHLHATDSDDLVQSYEFPDRGTVIDVAGGSGSLLAAILEHKTDLDGVLFDLPEVIERARPALTRRGLSGRCRLVAGSFFEEVPAGGDLYLLRRILHDWDDDSAALLLGKCREAMAERARLLIIESVIPPGNGWTASKLRDLNMLVLCGGRERTEKEFGTLLDRSGLRLDNITPTNIPHLSLIEALPVGARP